MISCDLLGIVSEGAEGVEPCMDLDATGVGLLDAKGPEGVL